ncbi:xyloglucan galactosyltransferase XLT2-like [Nicotiana sylvestris]|uniref:Xyloglucan galactosyltransferase KATAMARI1 homolog n=1 Tax=Nicotiana sylvestris TaxID=4096 RepID=A0A1U7XEF2_NICSY|nr:PREDICTED: xyloglucan galactosyltransferase KATAMARI1 homolog [Nicotiana sylvestris]
MLPYFHNSPLKPKTPDIPDRKSLIYFLQPLLSFHNPRTWLILTILLLQILLLLNVRSLPFSIYITSHPHHIPPPFTLPTTSSAAAILTITEVDTITNLCPLGKVYVYDLPQLFNAELIQNCHELNPWISPCEALSNDGFGGRATGLSKVVPESLIGSWHWTDQFALELIYHNRMVNYRCRTMEPESATAFYIPLYAGLAVGKYLFKKNSSAKDRDMHCELMLIWVQNQTYMKRKNGWDHFISMGRISWDFRRSKDKDWGSSCIYMPGMRNITRLLIEKNPWDYFDIGVPYPTGFHPSTANDITQWQNFVRSRERKTLFCFVGATRGLIKNDFRGLLLSHCYSESDSCRVLDCAGSKCSNGTSEILETFLDSDFCLQPRGDSFTRRSIFDCMVAGSIPVFFWKRTAYYQYEWFLPEEPESYSVFIDRYEVKSGSSIKAVLEKFSKEQVKSMREKVIENIPKIVYAKPNGGINGIKDAFDIAVEGVLRRIKKQEGGYKW